MPPNKMNPRNLRYRSRLEKPPPRKRRSNDFTGWVKERNLNTPLPVDVLLPPAYDDQDIAALRALRYGEASSDQQKRALEYIIWSSGCYSRVQRRDSVDSAYAAGRREHGCDIVNVMNTRTSRQSDSEQG